MAKPKPERVHPVMAREALRRAGGDRKAAYSRYVQLSFQTRGSLAPSCDNRDLQAWYNENIQEGGDE